MGVNLSFALAVALLFAGCRPPLELEPPSILLVVVDCLRADHVGAYGYERPTTPRLDEVAAEGITFEWAFAQSYWTRPSLPTIFTGLYPSEHGLLELAEDERGRWVGAALDPAVSMISEDLQAAGYATALVADQRQLSPIFGMAEGWDFFHYRVGSASSITGRFLDWVRHVERPRYFGYLHYLDIHWPYCPPETVRDRFDTGESQIDFCQDWRGLRKRLWSGALVLEGVDLARAMARYDEEILGVDHQLGNLFITLQRLGRWEETLVVITADHGEEFMEHGEMDHQSGPYDTLLHVPFDRQTADLLAGPARNPGDRRPGRAASSAADLSRRRRVGVGKTR